MSSIAQKPSKSKYQCTPQDGNRGAQQLCDLVSLCLHEPISTVKKILKSHKAIMQRLDWQRNHYLTVEQQNKWGSSFYLPRQSAYLDFLNTDNRSRVIATFHLGDYVYGLNYLMSFENPKRNQLVLNQRETSFPYRQNVLNKYGNHALDRMSHILSQHCNTANLVATLREEPSSLIMFADLPHQFGESIETKFFGRRAWFVKGPAVLALTARVPILPVINLIEGGSNIIEIGDLIDSAPMPGESFSECVQRLTQTLCRILESYLRRYPEQWRYISSMPAFFQNGGKAANL